jgi:hypothetical protein
VLSAKLGRELVAIRTGRAALDAVVVVARIRYQ